jgi:hypothetical protein
MHCHLLVFSRVQKDKNDEDTSQTRDPAELTIRRNVSTLLPRASHGPPEN